MYDHGDNADNTGGSQDVRGDAIGLAEEGKKMLQRDWMHKSRFLWLNHSQ